MDLLKNVRYIFQVPLDWFRRVDARVFGDHPGSGVMFEEASDGSRAVMLDFKVLDDRYGGSGGGTVKSVDNVSPDAAGNVALNALTASRVSDDGLSKFLLANQDGTSWSIRGTGAIHSGFAILLDDNVNSPLLFANTSGSTVAVGNVAATTSLTLNASAGGAKLAAHPTNQSGALAIATVGWANGKFASTSHTHGNVTSDGKMSNAAACFVTTDSAGRLIQYSPTDLPISSVKAIVGAFVVSGNTAKLDSSNVEGLDDAIDGRIDEKGVLTDEDISPSAQSALASGVTKSLTVVTGETWNGSALVYNSSTLTIANGVITAIADNPPTTIDTPTVVSWS